MNLSAAEKQRLMNKAFRSQQGRIALSQSLLNPVVRFLEGKLENKFTTVSAKAEQAIFLKAIIYALGRLQQSDRQNNENNVNGIVINELHQHFNYPRTFDQLISCLVKSKEEYLAQKEVRDHLMIKEIMES